MLERMQRLFSQTIEAITPQKIIAAHCNVDGDTLTIDSNVIKLSNYKNIYLCGSGKASVAMAESFEMMLGSTIAGGVVVTPYDSPNALKHVQTFVSTHPLPTIKSIEAADALIECFQKASENDLIIYLLSGGSSALIEKPVDGITLEEIMHTTQELLHNAVAIDELNSVRKHLSAIKGGRLAQYTKAAIEVIVFSDVLGNALQSIGSAPLYCDHSTFEEALQSVQGITTIDESVKTYLRDGANKLHEESPKYVKKSVSHHLIATNELVLAAVERLLTQEGFQAVVADEKIEGNAEKAAQHIIDVAYNQYDADVVVFGGEATVVVTGDGYGGRNQHFVLHALRPLAHHQGAALMSFATDGIDGRSSAAGAMATYRSAEEAATLQLDIDFYDQQSDSFNFFKQLNTLLISGPTDNNLLDVVIIFKKGA